LPTSETDFVQESWKIIQDGFVNTTLLKFKTMAALCATWR